MSLLAKTLRTVFTSLDENLFVINLVQFVLFCQYMFFFFYFLHKMSSLIGSFLHISIIFSLCSELLYILRGLGGKQCGMMKVLETFMFK